MERRTGTNGVTRSGAGAGALAAASMAGATVAEWLADAFYELGVRHAFGIVGGGVAPFAEALLRSPVDVLQFRHESGAAFAATEACFASERPTVAFTTYGPGLLNALTGITAARWEGAKVILVSGLTPPGQRGRFASQETSGFTAPVGALHAPGPVFDFAAAVETPADLETALSRIAQGFAREGGFVAHLALPAAFQASVLPTPRAVRRADVSAVTCSESVLDGIAALLGRERVAIWAGFGARRSAPLVRALAEQLAAPVLCSPRGKGVIPGDHPLALGVTGFGGHERVKQWMADHRPKFTLVLGSRLSEFTSFWSPALLPSEALIHVDVDPSVFGAAYPDFRTIGVHCELSAFLAGVTARLARSGVQRPRLAEPLGELPGAPLEPRPDGPVRPSFVMQALQRQVVTPRAALVLAEPGNSFAWAHHALSFPTPSYRTSTRLASMGHCCAGVVGAAVARGGKALAIVGDGALLMNNEISTAVRYGAPAVWVVLNDSQYGMVENGMTAQGYEAVETEIPNANFAMVAHALGAGGVRVEREDEVEGAVDAALAASGPFVVDVVIDRTEPAPSMARIKSLIEQGVTRRS